MNNNHKCNTPSNLKWVFDQGGEPIVRWSRVAAFVGIVVGSNALAMLLLSLVIGIPFKLPIPLSNESIAILVACQKLKYLSLDESKLTTEQVTDLKRNLPNLILNGKRWKDRKM